MGSAHAVFAPPGFGTPQESIHGSLVWASAVQPLDQPFHHGSIHRATSPLGAVHGLGPCRFRSPRVWYAPGIDPPISRLRFGCPTAGPTIPFSHVTPRPVTRPRCGSAGGPPRPRATILRVFILVLGHQKIASSSRCCRRHTCTSCLVSPCVGLGWPVSSALRPHPLTLGCASSSAAHFLPS